VASRIDMKDLAARDAAIRIAELEDEIAAIPAALPGMRAAPRAPAQAVDVEDGAVTRHRRLPMITASRGGDGDDVGGGEKGCLVANEQVLGGEASE
jgi:hypothetical protein